MFESFKFFFSEFVFKYEIELRIFIEQMHIHIEFVLFFKSIIFIVPITNRELPISDKPDVRSEFIYKIPIMRNKEYCSFVFFK